MGAKAGLQAFVGGIPVELLWRKSKSREREVWRARRLFVEPEEIDVVIKADDQLHCLHTKRALAA